MRILLTGASSFTGTWFATALARAGHEVVAALRGDEGGYSGWRARRVALLGDHAERRFGLAFGSEPFLDLSEHAGPFDLFCHHAADVSNYKAADFDVEAAVAANTRNIAPVLGRLAAAGARAVMLTGSVFEPGAAIGDRPEEAGSAYGLSKGRTTTIARAAAARAGLGFGHFVVANPFGPYEEARFCAYLAGEWLAGRMPEVRTPLYVRDNIPVDLLAGCYARAAQSLYDKGGERRFAPSFHVERQGAFAERMARELAPRFGRACALRIARQTDFSEPMVRINSEPAALDMPDWDEDAFWDRLAEHYLDRFAAGKSGAERRDEG